MCRKCPQCYQSALSTKSSCKKGRDEWMQAPFKTLFWKKRNLQDKIILDKQTFRAVTDWLHQTCTRLAFIHHLTIIFIQRKSLKLSIWSETINNSDCTPKYALKSALTTELASKPSSYRWPTLTVEAEWFQHWTVWERHGWTTSQTVSCKSERNQQNKSLAL